MTNYEKSKNRYFSMNIDIVHIIGIDPYEITKNLTNKTSA
jgi:hypothetical protein